LRRSETLFPTQDSVGDLILFLLPKLQHPFAASFVTMEEGDRVGALAAEDLGDESVVEADGGGFGLGVAVDDPLEVGPVDGAEAHGAGLASAIESAAFQVEASQLLGGDADRLDLGMGGGVVAGEDFVVGGGDHFALVNDHGAEGAAVARFDPPFRLLQGEPEVSFLRAHREGVPSPLWPPGP